MNKPQPAIEIPGTDVLWGQCERDGKPMLLLGPKSDGKGPPIELTLKQALAVSRWLDTWAWHTQKHPTLEQIHASIDAIGAPLKLKK